MTQLKVFSSLAIAGMALSAACDAGRAAPARSVTPDAAVLDTAAPAPLSSTDASDDPLTTDGETGARSPLPINDADEALPVHSAYASPACGPESVARIAVGTVIAGHPFDPLGYAPYAIDGCTLVYVTLPAPGQSSGELRVHRLATGVDDILAPAAEQPTRPCIAGDLIAWEAVIAGKSAVRLSAGGAVATVSGPFDHAGEPRVTNDAVAFTAWLSPDDAGDTDVYLFSPVLQQLSAVATGAGQQRFADVSASFVAVTDFSEDPAGAFSWNAHRDADIVVFDRLTLAKTVRHLPGKQAFPMLGTASRLSYLDWGAITPEPKFSAYAIRVGNVFGSPALDGNVKGTEQVLVNTPYVRPSVRGDWLEWVDDSPGNSGLFRRPIDLSQIATSALNGHALLGPAAGQPLTVVATPGSSSMLVGVAR